MMRMVDLLAINMETRRLDSRCSLEKEFTKLIHMNHIMVLYLIINYVNLFHGCVCDPLT